MARVKLILPDKKSLFSTKIPVRITDLNYGNHLGNDRLLGILHEARAQWLHHCDLSELNIGTCGMIMADVMIAYKNESYYGDMLEIELFVNEINSKSFDLFYSIKTERANGIQLLIAMAKTGMVCYDYEIHKIVQIPHSFLEIINQ